MNLKRLTAAALAALCIAGTLTGCANSKSGQAQTAEEQAAQAEARMTQELQLNDYRGAYTRTESLKDNVLKTIENMKSNNVTLRTDNPNSFWNTDGYQDFVVNFLSTPIITDGQWFNEEETDWEAVVKQLSTTQNSFTQINDGAYTLKAGITITHNEKDDYSIAGVPFEGKFSTDSIPFKGTLSYRFLYDCDKDWAKGYATLPMDTAMNIAAITPYMFEYCRISNDAFAIQTSRERLYVVFEPVESDTDFRERKVKEFYYSKLTQDGMRTKYTPYEPLLEYDEETGKYDSEIAKRNNFVQGYKVINDKGDIATQYGKNDSMFLTEDIVKGINSAWVFEDGSLQQAICYKDKALVVTTYNKLSEKYERFTYSAESVKDEDIKKLESLVSIEGLVGEQEIPEINVPEVDESAYAKPKGTEAPTEVAEGETTETTSSVDEEVSKMREQAENGEVVDLPEGETVPESTT